MTGYSKLYQAMLDKQEVGLSDAMRPFMALTDDGRQVWLQLTALGMDFAKALATTTRQVLEGRRAPFDGCWDAPRRAELSTMLDALVYRYPQLFDVPVETVALLIQAGNTLQQQDKANR